MSQTYYKVQSFWSGCWYTHGGSCILEDAKSDLRAIRLEYPEGKYRILREETIETEISE